MYVAILQFSKADKIFPVSKIDKMGTFKSPQQKIIMSLMK